MLPAIKIESTLYDTPFGAFQACWSEVGLHSFLFAATPSCSGNATFMGKLVDFDGQEDSATSAHAATLRRAIKHYLQTGYLEFAAVPIDFGGLSGFAECVLKTCLQIPTGETWTYAQLAVRSGKASAARAVGGVMARNRWPVIIPCHRVVGASGKLTGYSGAGGTSTKQRLIEFEQSQSQSFLF